MERDIERQGSLVYLPCHTKEKGYVCQSRMLYYYPVSQYSFLRVEGSRVFAGFWWSASTVFFFFFSYEVGRVSEQNPVHLFLPSPQRWGPRLTLTVSCRGGGGLLHNSSRRGEEGEEDKGCPM